MELRKSSRLEEARIHVPGAQLAGAVGVSASPRNRLLDTSEDNFFLSSDESDSERFRLARVKEKPIHSIPHHVAVTQAEPGCTRKLRRGKRGILEGITQAPMDIFLEILAYLEPLDVLRLARTTKEMRSFLMNRSKASLVWRTSRTNIEGLPPLPQDLSEPEYANLCFDSRCHFCMQSRCEKIIWQFRVRCCKKCFPIVFVSRPDLHSVWKTSYPLTFLVFQKVGEYIPYVSVTPWKGPWGGEDKVYLPSTIRQFRREYRSVHFNEELLEQWISSKRDQAEALSKHVFACAEWHKVHAELHSKTLQDVRERRRDAIYQKLRDLGWAEEINKVSDNSLSRHRLVYQTKELTEQGWVKIRPQLVQLMETLKARRLEKMERELQEPSGERDR